MTTIEPGRTAYEARFEDDIGPSESFDRWEGLSEEDRALWRRVEEAVLRQAAANMRERAAQACEAAAEAAEQLRDTTNQNGVPDLSFAWGCAAEACRNRAAAIRALRLQLDDQASGAEPVALLPDLSLPRA